MNAYLPGASGEPKHEPIRLTCAWIRARFSRSIRCPCCMATDACRDCGILARPEARTAPGNPLDPERGPFYFPHQLVRTFRPQPRLCGDPRKRLRGRCPVGRRM